MSDIIKESADYIRKTLKATRRPGITDLLDHMDEIGFFTAPASGGNHLCCDCGLVVHTANVMKLADKLGKVLLGPEKFKEMRNSIRIAAGLHDLGKCGQFGKKYYVENLIKDGRPTKAEPEPKPQAQNAGAAKPGAAAAAQAFAINMKASYNKAVAAALASENPFAVKLDSNIDITDLNQEFSIAMPPKYRLEILLERIGKSIKA